MTDPKRRPSDFEGPSQFAPEYPAKIRELLKEDIWRIDTEQFPSDDGCRDHTSAVPDLWFSRSLDPTTVPAAWAAGPRSSGRHWLVRLVVLAGFLLVVAGLRQRAAVAAPPSAARVWH
jgi:hypothetical protein